MRTYSDLLGPVAYGVGFQQVKAPADPAPGAELTLKVPGDRAWRVIMGSFNLVTSATVGTRFPDVTFLDGDGNTLCQFRPAATQAASAGARYGIAVGFMTDSLSEMIAIPSVVIHPGFKIKIGAEGIVAGDQISGIRLLVEEFPIGRGGFDLSGIDAGEPEAVS